MKLLRETIRRLIVETIEKEQIIPPPPAETREELDQVINQYHNRYNPESLQMYLDVDMNSLFDHVIMKSGRPSAAKLIGKLKKHSLPIVDQLKKKYKRPRPGELAAKLNLDWESDDAQMTTDDTYSYPSGHTCQSYYIAYNLSDVYPDLAHDFMKIAEMVAQSRVDRGVHFPSDLDAGRFLAKKLYAEKGK